MDGHRSIKNVRVKPILEDWTERGNMTKEEHRALKTAQTNLKKFIDSVIGRMNTAEKEAINRQILKFDFRLIDDYTLQKIYRDCTDRYKVAAVPREQFESWCRDIMDIYCKNCTKHFSECELYTIFNDNFIPESSWDLENCRYAYKELQTQRDEEKIRQYQEFKRKRMDA